MSVLISLTTKLVKSISPKRVMLWCATGTFAIIAFTVFEHRRELYQISAIGNPHVGHIGATFNIGGQSRSELSTLVRGDENILAAGVLSADMRLNLRSVVFVFSQEKQDIVAAAPGAARLPLFTTDLMNNNQVIRSINGEFSCALFAGSVASSIAQFANSKSVYVCQSGLPPYYGFFTGFITILLATPPSIEEQHRLKTSLDIIATEIYLRDIIPASNWKLGQ